MSLVSLSLTLSYISISLVSLNTSLSSLAQLLARFQIRAQLVVRFQIRAQFEGSRLWLLQFGFAFQGFDFRIRIRAWFKNSITVRVGCNRSRVRVPRSLYQFEPTSPPANKNLMELQVMIDACRGESAKNITAGIQYFGYARADRKNCITSKGSVHGVGA